MQPSDKELMARFQKGDRACFNLLVWRWQKALTNFVCRFIGDEEEARDITQEVFLRVYKQKKAYRPVAKFSTWLYRIAINLCKNWTKKKRRGFFVSLHTPLENPKGEAYALEDTLPNPTPSPEVQLHRKKKGTSGQKGHPVAFRGTAGGSPYAALSGPALRGDRFDTRLSD